MTFSVLILAVLWVLQFLLLNTFYHSMKLNEFRNTGDMIVGRFDVDLDSVEFHKNMNEFAYQNSLRIIIIDEPRNMMVNFDRYPTEPRALLSLMGLASEKPNFETIDMALQRLDESGSDMTYYLDTDNTFDMMLLVYIAKINDINGVPYYMYISLPIPEIDSTQTVLRQQFIIITIILFILSSVAALLISRKMSKPILRLTKSAERLLKGELDENIYDDGYTEINQLASAFNYAANELRGLDKYRREFIANVSHDLKTPLTIIKLYGEMIKDVSGNDPGKRNSHCDTIIKEADWLMGMVGEIVELSKLESDSTDIAMTDVNLSRCLTETLAGFQILAEKSGYSFETSIEDDLFVFGNEPMLRRTLYNLISNAVNFTGEDKRVIISLKHNAGNARLEVTDTGEGIPKDRQSVIWDRYYKSNETHKRAVIGTGIGLSIVKNVLMLHKAEYGIVSEIGKGSTFWFDLKMK
jgi:signal transduction histidine kinase